MIDQATAIGLALKLVDGIATASEAYQRHRRKRARAQASAAAARFWTKAKAGGMTSAEVREMMAKSGFAIEETGR